MRSIVFLSANLQVSYESEAITLPLLDRKTQLR